MHLRTCPIQLFFKSRHLRGVMVSILSSSVVHQRLIHSQIKPKTDKIIFVAALKSKNWLTWSPYNMSKWHNMSTRSDLEL